MKTRRKTEYLIEFCSARMQALKKGDSPVLTGFIRRARTSRLRISGRLLNIIREATAANEMNLLLHALSSEIRDRGLMTLLYDLLDIIVRDTVRARSMPSIRRRGRQRHLEERLLKENPVRHSRIREALREEARLRGLPDDESVWPHHCHIWKSHLSYSSEQKLERILKMEDETFSLTIYRFLADLAGAARVWRSLNRFDWRQFSYSGFTEKDLTALFDPRQVHLKTLGLRHDAEEGQIRNRYKELARKHHPDQGGDGQVMAGINLAYAALMRRDPASF